MRRPAGAAGLAQSAESSDRGREDALIGPIFAAWRARAVCPPAAAAHFSECAYQIAKSVGFGVAASHGQLLGKSQRFVAVEEKS